MKKIAADNNYRMFKTAKEQGRTKINMANRTDGIIVDQESGDAFRKWLNTYHSGRARYLKIDMTGAWDNMYMAKAWDNTGDYYKQYLAKQKESGKMTQSTEEEIKRLQEELRKLQTPEQRLKRLEGDLKRIQKQQ